MGDVKTPLLTRISKELATLMDGNANRADVVLPFLHQLIAELPSSPTPSLPEDAARVVERLKATYTNWNHPPSEGLPEGAGVVLEAAALIQSLSSQLAGVTADRDRLAADLEQAKVEAGEAMLIVETQDQQIKGLAAELERKVAALRKINRAVLDVGEDDDRDGLSALIDRMKEIALASLEDRA